MSCGQPDPLDTVDEPAPVASTSSAMQQKPTVCLRCREPPVVFIRAGAYCKSCFDNVIIEKFKRATEGARFYSRTGRSLDPASVARKEKIAPRSGAKRSKVMLAVSGGKSSRLLLDLAKTIIPERAPGSRAPLAFDGLVIVHVDESELLRHGSDFSPTLSSICASLGFPLISLPLSAIFASTSSDPTKSLQTLLSPPTMSNARSKPDPTSTTSLRRSLLLSLLRRTAIQESCDILMTGENANRIAALTLEGMACGRGWGLGEEVGVDWLTNSESTTGVPGPNKGDVEREVLVVRPLSSVLDHEIDAYNQVHELEIPLATQSGMRLERAGEEWKKSIPVLSDRFIDGLETEFPGTVQTVLRTVQKLGMRSWHAKKSEERLENCAVCGLPKQSGASDWRSAITIASFDDLELSSSSNQSSSKIGSRLCYGCLLVNQAVPLDSLLLNSNIPPNVKDLDVGPGPLDDEVIGTKEIGMKEVSEKIRDFLLE